MDMKKEISPAILIGAVAAVIVVVAIIGWFVFSPPHSDATPQQLQQKLIRKDQRESKPINLP